MNKLRTIQPQIFEEFKNSQPEHKFTGCCRAGYILYLTPLDIINDTVKEIQCPKPKGFSIDSLLGVCSFLPRYLLAIDINFPIKVTIPIFNHVIEVFCI